MNPTRMKYSKGRYEEIWTKDRRLHNDNGPSWVEYRGDGSKLYEGYYNNGQQHNENGPARIWYSKDGSINYVAYYLNGVELTKEEWLLRVDPLYKELI